MEDTGVWHIKGGAVSHFYFYRDSTGGGHIVNKTGMHSQSRANLVPISCQSRANLVATALCDARLRHTTIMLLLVVAHQALGGWVLVLRRIKHTAKGAMTYV